MSDAAGRPPRAPQPPGRPLSSAGAAHARGAADAGAAGRHPRLAGHRRLAGDREVRPRLPHRRSDWDPVAGRVRRPGDDLRHAGHLADRAGDRGAGELRHRAVPHRAVAGLAASARWARRSSCWRPCLASSTACGACSCSARSCRTYVQQPLQTRLRPDVPLPRRAVLRARRWASASSSAGIILAIMIIPFIASVMRDVFEVDAAAAQGVGLRARLHHLGSGVARSCCRTPRPAWSAASCWAWAARWARPWRSPSSSATPTSSTRCRCSQAGQQHHLGAGQRVRRSRRRACTRRR